MARLKAFIFRFAIHIFRQIPGYQVFRSFVVHVLRPFLEFPSRGNGRLENTYFFHVYYASWRYFNAALSSTLPSRRVPVTKPTASSSA